MLENSQKYGQMLHAYAMQMVISASAATTVGWIDTGDCNEWPDTYHWHALLWRTCARYVLLASGIWRQFAIETIVVQLSRAPASCTRPEILQYRLTSPDWQGQMSRWTYISWLGAYWGILDGPIVASSWKWPLGCLTWLTSLITLYCAVLLLRRFNDAVLYSRQALTVQPYTSLPHNDKTVQPLSACSGTVDRDRHLRHRLSFRIGSMVGYCYKVWRLFIIIYQTTFLLDK